MLLSTLANIVLFVSLQQVPCVSARPHHQYSDQNFAPIPNGRQLPLDDYDRQELAASEPGNNDDPRLNYEQFGLDEPEMPKSGPRFYADHQQRGGQPRAQRRDDIDDELDDDEDGDQSAAASYQNEDNDGGQGPGAAQDGYGDNDPEPDASYEETPNEQEGQADLERFFDDHLGASDRDGMDKENLPSNLIQALAELPVDDPKAINQHQRPMMFAATNAAPLSSIVNPKVEPAPTGHFEPIFEPTIETTRYIKLPDQRSKLIITHQVTRNQPDKPLRDLDEGSSSFPQPKHQGSDDQTTGPEPLYGWEKNKFKGKETTRNSNQLNDEDNVGLQTRNHIHLTEDDDFDQIFVTNATNRPFKIDALGGYDPEQDFNEAAADIEDNIQPQRTPSSSSRHSQELAYDPDENPDESMRQEMAGGEQKEASHNQAETEPLYEDASETDEITFGQDDPYQTDLEAEMRQQEFDKVGQFLSTNPKYSRKEREKNAAASEREDYDAKLDSNHEQRQLLEGARHLAPKSATTRESDSDSDLDEGAWVNDGVEDMEIPSQSHQNMILEKASKQAEQQQAASGGQNGGPDAPEAGGTSSSVESETAPRSSPRRSSDDTADQEFKQDDLDLDDIDESSRNDAGKTGGQADAQTTSSNSNGDRDPSDSENEESQRMPDANYLKNDLIEDDSGY